MNLTLKLFNSIRICISHICHYHSSLS